MFVSVRRIALTKRSHAVVAVAFLFVMLVEWGSHSLAFAHAAPTTGMVAVASSSEDEHDDPCRTIVCCEGKRNDQKAPNFSHDLFPYGSATERANAADTFDHLREVSPLSHNAVDRIFRPKDPLLHPPEFS